MNPVRKFIIDNFCVNVFNMPKNPKWSTGLGVNFLTG